MRCHPADGVGIPLVLVPRERPETGFDVLPALFVLERLANGLGDEHAAASPPDAPVEPLHELAVKRYVQTHGHNLAHSARFYQWTPRVSVAIAICSKEARSSTSRSPREAAESGNTR